jgi:hypothetical protein
MAFLLCLIFLFNLHIVRSVCTHVTHPQAPLWTHCKSKGENNGRRRSWGTLLGSQHFEGRGACRGSEMGTRKIDKQLNYSHELAQTKQQVG